jgi:hypothetical protein
VEADATCDPALIFLPRYAAKRRAWRPRGKDQRHTALIFYDRPSRSTPAHDRPKLDAISPSFIVSNVDQTIAFYRDKLGFETKFQQPDRDPFFAIIGRDGAQIFIKGGWPTSDFPPFARHGKGAPYLSAFFAPDVGGSDLPASIWLKS